MRALLVVLLCSACAAHRVVVPYVSYPSVLVNVPRTQERIADDAALNYVATPLADASVIHEIRSHEAAISAAKRRRAPHDTRKAVNDFSDYLNSRGIH